MTPKGRVSACRGQCRCRSGALLFALLLLAAPPRTLAAAPDLSGIAYRERPGAYLPLDASFRDEVGRAVRLGDLLGAGPAILALMYFHCANLCGVVQDDLFHALALSGLEPVADYRLLAVSIDPTETSADAAHAKAADLARHPAPDAARGWHFLTGDAAAIGALADAVGFQARFDSALKQFIHPTGIVFVTAAGRVSGYLLGVGYQPGDVAAGVLRARSGGIARAALPILLLCFHFDAATGRYTLAIMRILRLGAALFALTLGGLLAASLGFGRRRA